MTSMMFVGEDEPYIVVGVFFGDNVDWKPEHDRDNQCDTR
jgi:hypothetical protein